MSEPAKAFEVLLRKLHAVDNDSPEANAIRDEMEGPWALMTDAEQQASRKLSAELQENKDAV